MLKKPQPNTPAQPSPLQAAPKGGGSKGWLGLLTLLLALAAGYMLWQNFSAPKGPTIQTVSREGVVSRIQKLNRLETVAFNVDTVITSQREGTWQRLWQDEQKGLFIAHGRVVAGVDLSKLGNEMVQVTEPTAEQIEKLQQEAQSAGLNPDAPLTIMPNIMVTLPPSEIFSVYLDNIEVYDWQAGLFGMLEADPKILKEAQISAKKEVLERACQDDVMVQAEKNAKEQVEQLFALTGATVSVTTQGAGACQVVQ